MPWWNESASCSREQSDQRVGDRQPLQPHRHRQYHHPHLIIRLRLNPSPPFKKRQTLLRAVV